MIEEGMPEAVRMNLRLAGWHQRKHGYLPQPSWIVTMIRWNHSAAQDEREQPADVSDDYLESLADAHRAEAARFSAFADSLSDEVDARQAGRQVAALA